MNLEQHAFLEINTYQKKINQRTVCVDVDVVIGIILGSDWSEGDD